MNTLEKYAPSFNGKGATERLDYWNVLLSQNDFAALLESHESALATYIAVLRKAEIFEKCADASGALKQLKAFLCWNEDYSVDYCVLASLSYCCKDVDEFFAHSSQKEWVNQSWIVNEFYPWRGGVFLDCEVDDSWGEKNPDNVHITCLSLVNLRCAKPAHLTSLTAG